MSTTAILYGIAVLGGLGVVFGVILSFADKVFAVPVDERVALVRENVAGANCGACGYAGCDPFAEAVVRGEAPVNGCTPSPGLIRRYPKGAEESSAPFVLGPEGFSLPRPRVKERQARTRT